MNDAMQNVCPSKCVYLVVCLILHQASARMVFADRQAGVDDILSSSINNTRSITNYKMECDYESKTYSSTDKKPNMTKVHSIVFRQGDKFDFSYHMSNPSMKQNVDIRQIWNGQQYLSKQTEGKRSQLLFSENRNQLVNARTMPSLGDFLDGHILNSDNVLSHLLAGSKKDLQPNMEIIDGNKCYVLNGVSDIGHIKVWIDPANGYRYRKLVIRKKSGDIYGMNETLPFKINPERNVLLNEVIVEIDGIKIEKQGDTFFATEGTSKITYKRSDGSESYMEDKVKRSRIVLNPDFEKSGAFIMDGIPNGTKVYSYDFHSLSYIWHDGRAVLDIDKDSIDTINSQITQIKPEVKTEPEKSIPSKIPSSQNLATRNNPYENKDASSNIATPEKDIRSKLSEAKSKSSSASLVIASIVIVSVVGLIVLFKFGKGKSHG